MLDQAKSKKSQKSLSRSKARGSLWMWIIIGVVIISAAVGLFWWSQNQKPFSLVEGNPQLVVLIRSDRESVYQLRYDGRQPVNLQTLKVMLAGQVLHVDVRQVTMVHDDQEYVLAGDGSLPAGSELILEPGEEFDVHVNFRGQTLGGNYLYGFEIGYLAGERERTVRLVLDYDYAIIVE
jgi:hypothetical protein